MWTNFLSWQWRVRCTPRILGTLCVILKKRRVTLTVIFWLIWSHRTWLQTNRLKMSVFQEASVMRESVANECPTVERSSDETLPANNDEIPDMLFCDDCGILFGDAHTLQNHWITSKNGVTSVPRKNTRNASIKTMEFSRNTFIKTTELPRNAFIKTMFLRWTPRK